MGQALWFGIAMLGLTAASTRAHSFFTDALPKEEFAERRARVMAKVGDAVVLIQGAAELPGYHKFRQNNQFFYLTGVEVPRAILLMDSRTQRSTLYLQPRNERLERSEGPVLVPDEPAVELTGIAEVPPRDQFAQALVQLAQSPRVVYLPFRLEALGAAEQRVGNNHVAASAADPWEGRPSREAVFIEKIRAQLPGAEIRNLDPILDEMRMVKSPSEVALVREATRIACEAIAEAMRSAGPGTYEYELEAIGDYIFKKNNSQGFAYFGLVASGKNAHYPHYHAAQSPLRDGELALYDYAPDYKYYTSDVTRMFPANGKFSREQRELYGIHLRFYQALMASIRPQATPREIVQQAVEKMDAIYNSYRFSNSKFKDAALRFIEDYRSGSRSNRLGHWVGMEVHDVGVPFEVLKPGMIFTIEPALTIPEERVYVRLEDTILITPTGYENLSATLPVQIEDIERLMSEEGLGEMMRRRSQPTTSSAQVRR